LSAPFFSRSHRPRNLCIGETEKYAPRVRVIDDTNQQLGVMSLGDALQLARTKNLDLIEVAPTPRRRLPNRGLRQVSV